MEYFEKFCRDRYKRPCEAAKKAAEEWIKTRLGNDVIVAKDYNRATRSKAKTKGYRWVVYDGHHIYWVTVGCGTYEACVKVEIKDSSTRARNYLREVAESQGLSLKIPG